MPFGKYKNFADCTKQNSGKKNPKAYCAAIERKVKEGMPDQIIASEMIDVSEAKYSTDDDGKIRAKIHLIKAGRAKGKNRDYTAGALKKAAKEGIYDGLRMFVNHSDKPPTRRNLSELVSAVESTSWNERNQSVDGDVLFFSTDFAKYAEAAKKHIGVSADHRIRVTHVREGQEMVEKVQQIVGARSIDWVVYPAAGGEIDTFIKESEGEDEVEWGDVTLDQLKSKAPAVLEQYKTELAAESEPDPDPPDDPDEDKDPPANKKKVKTAAESESLTKADVERMVKEGLEEARKGDAQKEATVKAATEYFAKSGLPPRVQKRLANAFSSETSFDEKVAKEAVEDAKEELKELNLGKPVITGMGPSKASAKGGDGSGRSTVSVQESVEASFGIGKEKKATKKEDSSEKES